MSLVTAFSKYRVCSLNDLIYFEEIPKIKAIDLSIKNCTKYAETGKEGYDCQCQNTNNDYCLAR